MSSVWIFLWLAKPTGLGDVLRPVQDYNNSSNFIDFHIRHYCILSIQRANATFLQLNDLYSRWWDGWAAEGAGKAGWTPRGSASSPSTASWTDPSWLRPLASWVTRSFGSERGVVEGTRAGRHAKGRGSELGKHFHGRKETRNKGEKEGWKEGGGQWSPACALECRSCALRAQGRAVGWQVRAPNDFTRFHFRVLDSCAVRAASRKPLSPPPPNAFWVGCRVRHQVRTAPLLSAQIRYANWSSRRTAPLVRALNQSGFSLLGAA